MPRTKRRLAARVPSGTLLPLTLLLLCACGGGGDSPDATGPTGGDPSAVPRFTRHLTDLSHIRYIVPPGSVSGDDIKGHAYVQGDGTALPVYAPVDMQLVAGTWVGLLDDYGFDFVINRRFRLRLGHITDPRPDIRALIPRTDPSSRFIDVSPVSLRAGELIGTTTGTPQTNGFDFGLYDMEREQVTPNTPRHRAERNFTKLNSVCAFAYFDEALAVGYRALFGSIGGVLVPGAACRTIVDVTGAAGGVAGEWHAASGARDGAYPAQFAIGWQLDGGVRVVGFGNLIEDRGAVMPRTVRDVACYPDPGAARHVYIRLSGDTEAFVTVGGGPCPTSAPSDGRRYLR